jgi:tRNA-modifying protein YgfZ
MPTVHLRDRAIIVVEGVDAETFLQNIITTDLASLGEGEARVSALLSPQGKILFDFLVSRAGGERFLLDCRAALADDFIRRLTLYRMRAKAVIAKRDQELVAISWGADSSASQIDSSASQNDSAVSDTRFPKAAKVFRHYALPLPGGNASEADWHALRIEHGVAESGFDYAAGDAFPHDVLLDENGGVGFKKGCYIGQEVVSRMQHRGTARRRILIAAATRPLPASGMDVLAGDRAIGTLGTVVGREALAIVRIDRVKEALDAGKPITADSTPLMLKIPPHASFTFPEAATAERA